MIDLTALALAVVALAMFVRILAFVGSHHKQLCRSTMRRYELYKVLIGVATASLLQGLSFLLLIPNTLPDPIVLANPVAVFYSSAALFLYTMHKLLKSLEMFLGRRGRHA